MCAPHEPQRSLRLSVPGYLTLRYTCTTNYLTLVQDLLQLHLRNSRTVLCVVVPRDLQVQNVGKQRECPYFDYFDRGTFLILPYILFGHEARFALPD